MPRSRWGYFYFYFYFEKRQKKIHENHPPNLSSFFIFWKKKPLNYLFIYLFHFPKNNSPKSLEKSPKKPKLLGCNLQPTWVVLVHPASKACVCDGARKQTRTRKNRLSTHSLKGCIYNTSDWGLGDDLIITPSCCWCCGILQSLLHDLGFSFAEDLLVCASFRWTFTRVAVPGVVDKRRLLSIQSCDADVWLFFCLVVEKTRWSSWRH